MENNNKIQIFTNAEFGSVRTVEIDGVIHFVGKDVAQALGYSNTRDALAKHVDDEDKGVAICDTPGGKQEMTVINESGLYSLVLSSKLPTAKKFKHWVTSEILPSIRKHGAYMTPETLEKALYNPDFLIRLATELKDTQNHVKQLELTNSQLTVDNQIMQPKAEYFDELVDRNLLLNFTDTAKELGVKRKVFIQFLLDKKYIYRDKKGVLKPYANKNSGLFELKESMNDKTNWSGTQTLITPKGRETFRLLLLA